MKSVKTIITGRYADVGIPIFNGVMDDNQDRFTSVTNSRHKKTAQERFFCVYQISGLQDCLTLQRRVQSINVIDKDTTKRV